jgi:hypothetical protein
MANVPPCATKTNTKTLQMRLAPHAIHFAVVAMCQDRQLPEL